MSVDEGKSVAEAVSRQMHDCTVEQDYRDRLNKQHDELLAVTKGGFTSLTEALHDIQQTIYKGLAVPVSCVMIVSTSAGFFYFNAITEWSWMVVCLVSLSPWYGTGIAETWKMLRGQKK